MPAFDTLTLRSERLRSRPLRADDVAALFTIFSDPEVMRYWSTPPWASVDEAHVHIARDARELPGGERVRLIGTCSVFARVKQCRRAELGYGQKTRAGELYDPCDVELAAERRSAVPLCHELNSLDLAAVLRRRELPESFPLPRDPPCPT